MPNDYDQLMKMIATQEYICAVSSLLDPDWCCVPNILPRAHKRVGSIGKTDDTVHRIQ